MEHLDLFILLIFDVFLMTAAKKIAVEKGNKVMEYIGTIGIKLSIICLGVFLFLKAFLFFIY